MATTLPFFCTNPGPSPPCCCLQEVELGDAASVLHSPGLLEFAVSAGLWRPSAGPFNFFRAFMSHGPRDARSNLPRVCALQWRLGGRACQCAAADQPPAFLAPPPLPPFLGPGRRLLGLPDVAGGLREHYSGSAHDPYRSSGSTPGPGAWRPVALLRTSAGHVARLRADPALPHGLRGSNYVAMGMPLLAPFIPIYAGLPGGALPRQLARAGPQPDARSLLWAARRLQALVFQDLAALLPGAAAAIQAWEADVEARQRPGMERRYIAAAAGGNETAAADILAGFTADLAAQASQLLRRLTRQAAQALGLPAVPPDDELLRLLDAAADAYSFRPTDDRPVQQA
jgi:dipeptidase